MEGTLDVVVDFGGALAEIRPVVGLFEKAMFLMRVMLGLHRLEGADLPRRWWGKLEAAGKAYAGTVCTPLRLIVSLR